MRNNPRLELTKLLGSVDNHSCDPVGLPDNIFVPWCLYIMLDLHLPEMRQLFKDARRFQHSELIVVEAPSNRGEKTMKRTKQEPAQKDAAAAPARLTVLPCTEGRGRGFW